MCDKLVYFLVTDQNKMAAESGGSGRKCQLVPILKERERERERALETAIEQLELVNLSLFAFGHPWSVKEKVGFQKRERERSRRTGSKVRHQQFAFDRTCCRCHL
jgi:hypothetical protein